MQCGICRIPFKLEYFSDDNNLIQIYKTKISEQRRNLNINSEVINIRESNRNISQSNNYSRYRSNVRDVQIQILSQNSDKYFIVLFHPNKCVCLSTLLANILMAGLGTLILGMKNLNLYEFVLSLVQFGFCYPFISKAIDIKKNKKIDKFEVNSFMWIYLLSISFIVYLSSIYVGIFHNFIFYNPRKIKNKEKAICVILLNIILGGIGTLFHAIVADGIELCARIKYLIIGIFQACGFSVLILSISIYTSVKLETFLILFIIGIFSYSTSIYAAFRFYKNIYTIS